MNSLNIPTRHLALRASVAAIACTGMLPLNAEEEYTPEQENCVLACIAAEADCGSSVMEDLLSCSAQSLLKCIFRGPLCLGSQLACVVDAIEELGDCSEASIECAENCVS